MLNRNLSAFLISLLIFSSILSFTVQSRDPEDIKIEFFYGQTCPHCDKAEAFLDKMEERYNVTVERYEVYFNKENQELFKQRLKENDISTFIVPITLIEGCEPVIGYQSDQTTGKKIEEFITKCFGDDDNVIELPVFGKIDLDEIGILGVTVIIGALDGFNPCAMTALIFLLIVLLNTSSISRKRMLIIGGAFILVSGLVYYLFIAALLNLFLIIGYMDIVRYAIGLFAIGFGIMSIKDYFYKKVCESAKPGSVGAKLLNRMKNVIEADLPLYMTVGWVILLAVGVNVIELACTPGFPAVYTEFLATQNLSAFSYYGYLFIYIIFYMVDDMLIFSAVILTMSTKTFIHKYGKVSKLIGGFAIIILGILLILGLI